MEDEKLVKPNNKLHKQPFKSKEESYDETLAFIKEKGIRCVFNGKEGFDLLLKLHQMNYEYMLRGDHLKSEVIKQFLSDINNIFNKVANKPGSINNQKSYK